MSRLRRGVVTMGMATLLAVTSGPVVATAAPPRAEVDEVLAALEANGRGADRRRTF